MFAQRTRSPWPPRDVGGGFADANMQERREYEVPLREREREDGFRRQQPRKASDPWGRPQRVLQRRDQRAMMKPPPQHLEPLPQREPPPIQRRELPPPPLLREPQPERYFCPNCTCPSCRPDDPNFLSGGGGGGMFLDGRGMNQSRSMPSPDRVQVLDDRMRQRYDALPSSNDGYFPRERLPIKVEEPRRREDSWPPRQEQRSGPNWGPGGGGGGEMRSGAGGRRPSDWNCASCNAHNFADKTACYVCSLPKPEGGFSGGQSAGYNGGSRGRKRARGNRRAGDWDCPECSAHNFASKTACFKCNIPKPENLGTNKKQTGGGGGRGGGRAGRAGGRRRRVEVEHRPGDWTCSDCNAHNFRRNVKCFKCDSPKEA